MNPLAIMFWLRLIGRYLRSSGDPGCERAGQQIEDDLNGTWDSIERGCGYVWLGCLGLLALFIVLAAVCQGCEWLLGRR